MDRIRIRVLAFFMAYFTIFLAEKNLAINVRMIGEGCIGNTLGENGSGLFEEEFSWRDSDRPLTASVSHPKS
jgi:hypothetical protein